MVLARTTSAVVTTSPSKEVPALLLVVLMLVKLEVPRAARATRLEVLPKVLWASVVVLVVWKVLCVRVLVLRVVEVDVDVAVRV